MKHAVLLTWLMLMIGLFSIEWVRTVMLGVMALGVLSIGLAFLVQVVAMAFAVAGRWWSGTRIGTASSEASRHLPYPLS